MVVLDKEGAAKRSSILMVDASKGFAKDGARTRLKDIQMQPGPTRLGITAIETTCIRVPLGRIFRGSRYEMSHRSTIVTRVHTDAGIVGELDGAKADERTIGLMMANIVPDEVAKEAH